MMKNSKNPTSESARTATPTPMPACAAVESEVEVEESLGAEDEEVVCCAGSAVGAGRSVVRMEPPEDGCPEEVVEEEVLVEEPKSERSRCWNWTVMGCAHMEMAPETAICEELPRAETVVVPENWEMHPMNRTELEVKKLMVL